MGELWHQFQCLGLLSNSFRYGYVVRKCPFRCMCICQCSRFYLPQLRHRVVRVQRGWLLPRFCSRALLCFCFYVWNCSNLTPEDLWLESLWCATKYSSVVVQCFQCRSMLFYFRKKFQNYGVESMESFIAYYSFCDRGPVELGCWEWGGGRKGVKALDGLFVLVGFDRYFCGRYCCSESTKGSWSISGG